MLSKVASSDVEKTEADKLNSIVTVKSLDGQIISVDEKYADQALQYAKIHDDFEFDEAFDRKLVRKLDFYILPLVCALMACQLMDKTTNSYASVLGLRTDLDMLTGQTYSWVGSSFYFGYLVSQFPANRMLQALPFSKTLGTVIVLWGVVLACHAACRSSAPFLVCRVLLGFLEGFMSPAYIHLMNMYWKKNTEHFSRSCIYVGFQGFGSIVGASIAYGLYKHEYSMPSWRLLYVITGLITIVLGMISIVHIPDLPVKAWFLDDKEKRYVVERIRENQQGFGNPKFKPNQAIEAFKDIRIYVLFFYGISYSIPNGGFTNFGTIMFNEDFRFSTSQSLLMGMCGGAIDVVFPITIAYVGSFFFKSRLLVCLLVNLFSTMGICLFAFSSPKGSRLFGYLTFYVATCVLSGILSYMSSNIAGSTKRMVFSTAYFIGYCAGNIVGPQTFITTQEPGYVGAKVAMTVSFIAGDVLILILLLHGIMANSKRDKKRAELGDAYVVPENIEFADLTDKENPEFRYSI